MKLLQLVIYSQQRYKNTMDGNDCMYILEVSKLKKGDIILTAEKTKTSIGIRISTLSDFSHAILYVGDHSYIHSDLNGVHSGNTQRLLFEKKDYATVLRCDLSDEKIEELCAYARTQIGKAYSVKEAVKTKLPLKKKKIDNRQFCSRLVAQAYDYANIPLVKNTNYCSPKDLMDSDLTFEVLDSVREAIQEEIDLSNTYNPLEKQSAITNNIFQKVRELTKQDIQTDEDILKLLISHPEYDIQITRILEQSGYLSLYEEEMNINKWRYDASTFMSLNSDPKILFTKALSELDVLDSLHQRYAYMYAVYQELYSKFPLQYIQVHVNLYSNLLKMLDLQLNTAQEVILATTVECY